MYYDIEMKIKRAEIGYDEPINTREDSWFDRFVDYSMNLIKYGGSDGNIDDVGNYMLAQ